MPIILTKLASSFLGPANLLCAGYTQNITDQQTVQSASTPAPRLSSLLLHCTPPDISLKTTGPGHGAAGYRTV